LEPAYRVGLAELSALQGRDGAAMEQMRAAHRLDPDRAALWAAHGRLAQALATAHSTYTQEAEDAYRRALTLAPNVAVYHHAYGEFLMAAGRHEVAVVAFETAVDLDATDVAAYRQLTRLYTMLGKEAEAARAQGRADMWAGRLSGME
jgi:Tfp pilus assembly protein PilF